MELQMPSLYWIGGKVICFYSRLGIWMNYTYICYEHMYLELKGVYVYMILLLDVNSHDVGYNYSPVA